MYPYWDRGKIKIYELPGEVHGRISGIFGSQMALLGQKVLGDDETIEAFDDTDIHMTDQLTKSPDKYFMHIHRRINYPQLIIEIGKTQTFPELHRAAVQYFQHQSTVMVTVKILETSRVLIACVYTRFRRRKLSCRSD